MFIDNRITDVDPANPTYLLVSNKDDAPNVFPLEIGSSVFVGAGSNCKIQLQDESVQQLHCMFSFGDDNVLKVQDWNTDATYLNGELVSEETTMQSGDVISVGRYCFTAVLDPMFHEGIAAEILGGTFSNEEDDAIELDLITRSDQDANKQDQIDEADQDSVASGFSVGDEPTNEVDVETKESSETSFKYDIDADLKEPSAGINGFDSLPTDLGFAFGSDDVSNDESSLLQMEIEQLRFELADRDSQILALRNEQDDSAKMTMVDDSDTVKMVTRLEDLLVELKESDDRIQNLEDLLQLAEEATAAEREERAQLEKWVGEIENRIGLRQIESEAEVAGLTKQLKIARDDAVVLQTHLHSVATAGASDEKLNAAVDTLNLQVEELRVGLRNAEEENRELLNRPVQSEDEAELRAKLSEALDELAGLRLAVSQERAETARRFAEFESMRIELDKSLPQTARDDSGDSRIRAMREHLREIHEQEQATKAKQKSDGLGGRISNLLARLR